MEEKKTGFEKLLGIVNLAGTAVLMNLMFLISCLPIVTIGQAWSGLVSAIRYNIRGDKWFQGFKTGFTHRFWRGTIVWCVLLPLNLSMLLDLRHAYMGGYIVPMIAAAVMFCLIAMITISFLILNVYVPTKLFTWITDAVNMVFSAPLWLFLAAIVNGLPAVLFLLFPWVFFYAIMIFVVIYFVIAAVCTTFALKNTLMEYLLEARVTGALLVEEGKIRESAEETKETGDGEE